MKGSLNIIYIAGEIRSGTTVIDLFLSNRNGAISVGELRNLEDFIDKKDIGWTYDWQCSCGKQVENCKFWNKIINEFHIEKKKKIETKIKRENKCEKNYEIANNCWKIYKIISKNENKKYIIDSSKEAIQLKYLNKTNYKNKIKTIYVIRDSRAVSFSQKNWELKNNPHRKPSYIRQILRWLITNISLVNLLSMEKKIEFIIIKYEDFAKNPNSMLDSVCKKLDISLENKNIQTISIQNKHTIAGSPNKIKFNKTPIKLDRRWTNHINLHKNSTVFLFGRLCNNLLNVYVRLKRLEINNITQ